MAVPIPNIKIFHDSHLEIQYTNVFTTYKKYILKIRKNVHVILIYNIFFEGSAVISAINFKPKHPKAQTPEVTFYT